MLQATVDHLLRATVKRGGRGFLGGATAAAMLGALVVLANPGAAYGRSPLLMEGKRTLHQRVLTRTGAELRPAPEASAPGKPVAPFSAYFVYDRRNIGGVEWVEVGPGREGADTAFIRRDQVIEWKQSMTLSFTNPAQRMGPDGPRLSMFLEDKQSLTDLLHDEAMIPKSRQWRAEARQARATGTTVPPDNPVIALEPEEHVDLQEQFYLLPIVEAQSSLVRPLRTKLLLMHVASASKEEAPPPAGRADFRVGVVFVVDTSSSMNPYIQRTRKAVERIFNEIRSSDLKAKVSFGMVGYRDSVTAVPRLEYTAKVFAQLEEETDPEEFVRRISAMSEASVSSRGFMEDALAGIDAAMAMPAWEKFGARYIVLITDASTRFGDDELAAVHMTPADLNRQAQEKGFAILAMHLKTPSGVNDHATARSQYEMLTRFGDQKLYYPIEGGDVQAFGVQVDAVSRVLVEMARTAIDDRAPAVAPADSDPLRQVGLAMRLAFLGRQRSARAPDVIEGWITDRDLEAIDRATVMPRVLLTKNQLSDLKVTVEKLIDLQRSSRLSPGEFFERLQSVAGNMVRDPGRIASGQVNTLGDVLGEYLDGLPYNSEIMTMDERRYISMGPVQQLQLVRRLESKVELYRRFNEDSSLWVRLAEGAPEGELVYPVPLDALP